MITRQEIEEREIRELASYAVKSRFSRGRQHAEDEHSYRTRFQRDKDRIIFSAAFRRLQYKTQVFSNFEGDYYRTRLTHTLEVSHIARSLARSLRLNEDLAEAIALAHDLGHGPFGHIGERILNECMAACGGFEHNKQSVRIVEELEDIYIQGKGLNLTYETREGLKKHTYADSHAPLPISSATLEAQVVDITDEIAYSAHDLDDGLQAGLFTIDDLDDSKLITRVILYIKKTYPSANTFQRMRLLIRYVINELVTDLVTESEKRLQAYDIKTLEDVKTAPVRIVEFSHDMKQQVEELKTFLLKHFYRNPHVTKLVSLAEDCLRTLFSTYEKTPEEMPAHFSVRTKKEVPARVVCDYIAGMTDRFAYDEYKRLSILSA